MRILASIHCLTVVCLTVLWAGSAAAADQKLSAAEKEEAAKMARVDAVAKQAFTVADRNHNDLLSKTEFPDAEALLEQGIMELGTQGVLGKVPKGPTAKDAASEAAITVNKTMNAAPSNLYKKNRISLSEFQLFARAMGAQADVQMAQSNAAREAYLQQMKSRGRNRRHVQFGPPGWFTP